MDWDEKRLGAKKNEKIKKELKVIKGETNTTSVEQKKGKKLGQVKLPNKD